MNELIDAVSARIKAPYFGYALLAFIALNWRAIFLLGAMDAIPQKRLAAFDSQTSHLSLFIYPLLIGAAAVLLTPWIRFFFSYVSRKPFSLIDNIQLESEHKNTIRKTELEQSRSKFFAAKEQELIQRAKRDEEVLTIEDEELKERLSAQIELLRKESDSLAQQLIQKSSAVDFSQEENELLKAASSSKSGTIFIIEHLSGRHIQAGSASFGRGEQREFAKYDSALKSLLSKGLIQMTRAMKEKSFELTARGWHVADAL